MDRAALAQLLLSRGIQPSAQRLVVAEYVLGALCHPTADRVFAEARARIPMISRATVYNTLNLLVRRGLLRQLAFAEGRLAFDPNLAPHHHFVDEATGAIHDIPWEALEVRHVSDLRAVKVSEYQVILRGTLRAAGAAPVTAPAAAGRRAAGRGRR